MIVEKIIILDFKAKEGNFFEFSPKSNIIHSESNTSGKSCLLKSIAYNLGLNVKKWPSGWDINNLIFKIFYDNNGTKGSIIRQKDNFWINDDKTSLSEKEYTQWLFKNFNFKIKLPLKNQKKYTDSYASAPLSLFYIDQDTSWKGIPYKNTVSLEWYESGSVPKTIFQYLLGISNDAIIELKEKEYNFKEKEKDLYNKISVLDSLKDKFISAPKKILIDPELWEEKANNFLTYTNNLIEKINDYTRKIFLSKEKLDKLLLEKNELDKIYENLGESYSKIKSRCTQCNSILTVEQSIQRMKICNTQIGIELYKNDLENKIAQIQLDLSNLSSMKNEIEKDYVLIFKKDSDDIKDINDYISQQSKEISNDQFLKINKELSTMLVENKKYQKLISKEIKELEKELELRESIIKKCFDSKLIYYKGKFKKMTSECKFLSFKRIKESGSVDNQSFFSLYMIYTNILMKYSIVKFPFIIDAIVKDELDDEISNLFYEELERTILNSKDQTIIALLSDKKNCFNNNHHYIELQKDERILKQDLYNLLESEIMSVISNN